MTKRKIHDLEEDMSDLYPMKKKIKTTIIQTTQDEIRIKKRKHEGDDDDSQKSNKKSKMSDVILHNENMSDYIKKRRDMMIYT